MGQFMQDTFQGIGRSVIGSVVGELINRPKINRIRGSMPSTMPSQGISQTDPNVNWQHMQQHFQQNPGGRYTSQDGSMAFDAPTYRMLQQQLARYTSPNGTVNWAAAAAGGVPVHLMGFDPSNPSNASLTQQGMSDAQTAQDAALQDQARAVGLAGDVSEGFAGINTRIDEAGQTAQTAFNKVDDQVADTKAAANAMPGQVQAHNAQQAASLEAFQKQQMDQLQTMISEGFAKLDADKAETLNNIAQNMAQDVGAALQSTRANLQNGVAQIMADPSLPPEQKAALKAQMGFGAAQEAAAAATPLVRTYRELETNTRTAFAKMFTDLSSVGESATASLSGTQQATRGAMGTAHSQLYGAALESAAKIGEGLASILTTNAANRATMDVNLNSLRIQAEATEDQYLTALLPYEQTPYITFTPILDESYARGINESTLAFNEEQAMFSNQMALEGFNMQAQSQFLPFFAPPPPEPPEPDLMSSLIGAGGDVAAGVGSAAVTGAMAKTAVMVCIDQWSLVTTAGGVKPLVFVSIGDRVLGADMRFHKVVAKDVGYVPVEHQRPSVRIITDQGYTVLATPEHPVGLNSIPVGDVKVGDPILCVTGVAKVVGVFTSPYTIMGDILLEDRVPYFANGVVVQTSPDLKEEGK